MTFPILHRPAPHFGTAWNGGKLKLRNVSVPFQTVAHRTYFPVLAQQGSFRVGLPGTPEIKVDDALASNSADSVLLCLRGWPQQYPRFTCRYRSG